MSYSVVLVECSNGDNTVTETKKTTTDTEDDNNIVKLK